MKLLIRRDFAGIGDWLLTLQVMKLLNRQYPELELHVDFLSTSEPMPKFVLDAFYLSDVRYHQSGPEGDYLDSGHLVYRWPPLAGAGLAEDMVRVLNERTGLDLQYEEGVYPIFNDYLPAKHNYVAMVAHAKSNAAHGKDWGYQNFIELNRLLSEPGRSIVQLGAQNDSPLPSARRVLGSKFQTVTYVLRECGVFIGLEDGLMHLAGMLGTKQLTIFTGNGLHEHINYPNQTKLLNPTPAEVAEAVEGLLQ